jgi:TalC/MipB family fructose-6-phosphate aldolase
MRRDGISDIDGTILKLAGIVPVLQVEALGQKSDEILKEVDRLLALGLDPKKTVFKIPISLEGAKACKKLVDKGIMVNLHLVYTIQQAYVAMSAGATYVCPLVGRLQDQGHDALGLVEQCVNAVETYGYDSKIMFSSVRYAEHVRNALDIGVHTITIPWKVLQQLTTNHFTELGTQQFFQDTKLMTVKVREVLRKEASIINVNKSITDALVVMSKSKLGAATIVDDNNQIKGVFTDGDLRRLLESEGDHVLGKKLSELDLHFPVTVEADALLYDASQIFKEKKFDNIVVVDNNQPVGILDIQDLL